MTRGLYISAIGMKTQMNKMDVVANNIANVDTAGFKKDTVAVRSFREEMMMRINDPRAGNSREIGPFSSGSTVDEVFSDFSNGALQRVSDPYTLAISGNGFFAVNVTQNGGQITEYYTRDGNFTLDSQGTLVTMDGGRVQGQNGDIRIVFENGAPTIDANGNIFQNGEMVDSLRLVDFADYTVLSKVGNNYYDAANAQQAVFTGMVNQGFYEASNVNSVREMVEIINISRAYEANQRFVTAMDDVLAKAVTEIASKQ